MFNPAEKPGKFNLDKEELDQWIESTKLILKPPWLQFHHDDYLSSVLVKSKEAIVRHREGVVQTNS